MQRNSRFDEKSEQLSASDVFEDREPGASDANSSLERPPVFDVFDEVQRRVKLLVDEKKQLLAERDRLHALVEAERGKVSELEARIKELLLVRDKHQSFVQQQEKVRAKVEGLLSYLETEEDQAD